jgi:hypothetical protein
MYRIVHPPGAGFPNGVAGFVNPFEYLELLAAELQHLRHERKTIQLPVGIKAGQDFFLTSNLNNFSHEQMARVFLSYIYDSHVPLPFSVPLFTENATC